MEDEGTLVNSVQKGYLRTFEQLIDLHASHLRAFAANKQPIPHVIDETGHEAFAFAHRHIDDFESGIPDTASANGRPYDFGLMVKNQPHRAPGIRGGGRYFQAGQSVLTPLPQTFPYNGSFAVAFWVKISPVVGRTGDDVILQWSQQESRWQVGCSHDSRGSLIVRCDGQNHILGTTDLSDGKWHHVGVRHIVSSPDNQIHFYVDGSLEIVYNSHLTASPSVALRELRVGDPNTSGFQGWIDQATIFDQAVSTSITQALHAL